MGRLEEVLNIRSIMFMMFVNLERGVETDVEEVFSTTRRQLLSLEGSWLCS